MAAPWPSKPERMGSIPTIRSNNIIMNILITGSQGFIARNVISQLQHQYTFINYDSDIQNFQYSQSVDLVLHLAALTGVRASHQQPDAYWSVNVDASKKIFDWAADNQISVIYASSSSVYEWWLNPYAATKKAMESVAPKNSLGLRFHTVYGPNSRPDMLYDMLLKGRAKYITDHYRDFTHINDVVSAIDLSIQANLQGVIDVGTGNTTSVIAVAKHLGQGHLPVKTVVNERTQTQADISILNSLGWKPNHHILEY